MKNTMQKYNNLRIYANYLAKNMFYSIKFAIFAICTYHRGIIGRNKDADVHFF